MNQPACCNTDLARRYASWCNSGMSVMGITNHVLIRHKVCFTGGISCWVLQDHRPLQGFACGGGLTVVILLNSHAAKLSSIYVYTQRFVLLSFQREMTVHIHFKVSCLITDFVGFFKKYFKYKFIIRCMYWLVY